MFELGGKAAVAGHGRPAILQHLHVGAPDVDHRFDREEHSGPQLRSRSRPSDVDDFRRVVKQPAHAMPAKIAHNSIAMLLRMTLDRMPDVAEVVAGLRLRNAE